jgi:hypothetical protein
MRFLHFALPCALILSACGDHGGGDAEPYPSLQECYDDHHVVESFGHEESIKICCLDHPLGAAPANVACGEDQAACETFVDAEVDDADLTLPDITAACAGYLVDREQ